VKPLDRIEMMFSLSSVEIPVWVFTWKNNNYKEESRKHEDTTIA
jgi:hypothetical protein